MKHQKGFTIIELFIAIIIVAILASGIISVFINNRGATEARAYQGAEKFITDNNISVKRKTCAGDSDGDGYGTCAITTSDGDRVRIECPTNWGDVNVWGASSCKEIFYDYQMQGGAIPIHN